MTEELNKGGRPSITEEDKRIMLQKLEPYLKSGLSVRKALLEAQVPNSTFYRLMDEDEGFREQIERFRNFTAVLLNNAVGRHLQAIIQKQNGYKEKDGTVVPPTKLNREEISFLEWFALNSNLTKQEFGERKDITMFDPEAEIQKVKGILEEKTDKKLLPLQ